MPQMNNSQARVVDPVLTSVAQGYKNNAFVGGALFPTVPVSSRGGKIIQFGKEGFQLYATGRSPGANTKRITFGYEGKPYVLESHSLEGMLPIETLQEAQNVPGIDMSSTTISGVQDIFALRLEKQQADAARNQAAYGAGNKMTLSGASQWNDPDSDPVGDVETAKEAIRQKTGKRPNVGVIGAAVFAVLKQHPKIIERTKYTGRDVPTKELLASFFGLDSMEVGDAVFSDDAGGFSDVWGKDMVLAYTKTGTTKDRGEPSYGYTYQLAGYPLVEEPYFERNPKSWVFPVTDEVAPVVAGADAGYLIINAVA